MNHCGIRGIKPLWTSCCRKIVSISVVTVSLPHQVFYSLCVRTCSCETMLFFLFFKILLIWYIKYFDAFFCSTALFCLIRSCLGSVWKTTTKLWTPLPRRRVLWLKATCTSALCATTTHLAITMASGPVRAARLSSRGAFKVTKPTFFTPNLLYPSFLVVWTIFFCF